MNKLEALRKQYQEKMDAAKALMAAHQKDGIMPLEIAQKVEGILGEADVIRAQFGILEKVHEGESFMSQPMGTQVAQLGWREAAPLEGLQAVDPLSWRELKLGKEDIQHLGLYKPITIRYQVPLCVQHKDYIHAFESYIRKGMEYVGPEDRKTLTSGVDTAGGFTVPESYQVELLKKTATSAVIRALARTITTSRDSLQWPKLVYTADDKYTSGVRLTWTGEIPSSSTVHRATDPTFGLANVPIHTAMCSIPLSNNLIEDSAFDLLGVCADLMGEAYGLGEDDVFINGDGVNKPMGMVTRVTVGDPADKISTINSGDANLLTADGLIELFFGLPNQYRRNARFVMNSQTAKAARLLKDTADRYLWDALNGGIASPAEQDSLLARMVSWDEFMPDIAANAYPIIFGDLKGYFIADRVGLSIQRLSELYAETNITLLLARRRLGADVLEPYRMRVHKIAA